MDTDSNEELYIADISKHETYSPEEKNFILEKLNNERLLDKNSKEELSNQCNIEDKSAILNELNEERLRVQKREEMRKKRLENKQIYKFGNKEYYKFIGMKREFYIEAEFCKAFSGKPTVVTLYYLSFNELKKKDVLIRIQTHSEKFFISYDAIRVYFKAYALEKMR